MACRLFSRVGDVDGLEILVSEAATIGRAADSDLVVTAGGVSKRHARIAWDGGRGAWILEDLGSTNGTEVDGMRLEGKRALRRLHVVTLAHRHHFIFQDLGAAPAVGGREAPETRPEVAAEATMAHEVLDVPELGLGTEITDLGEVMPSILERLARAASGEEGAELSSSQPAPEVEPASGRGPAPSAADPAWILEIELPEGPRRLRLLPGVRTVGRRDADVVLRTEDVSRMHARLTVDGGRVKVEDLGSTNGTFVNEVRIHGVVELETGDEIRFGEVRGRISRMHEEGDAG